tara:strand:- start:907 stop:1512 length:606 start_codon:yes stop_codon:yes gene_type:complete
MSFGNINTHNLLVVLLIFYSVHSFSDQSPKSEVDFRKLPKYCSVKSLKGYGDKNAYRMWEARLPGIFPHIHHYCSAMHSYQHGANIFPSNKREQQEKKYYFERVIGNIDYMEGHAASKNHPIFAEMYNLKGNAMVELGDNVGAIQYYEKALSVNIKYTPAYKSLASVYVKLGQTDMARQTLDKGLEQKPNSGALKRARKKL